MKIKFKILWFEDMPEWADVQLEEMQEIVENEFFE